ncbi:MAG: hypothetical protein KKA05_10435 [Alphaproteobacteria bacterium]|nr:hypothetical protein [Alphaproteobacteria bacterium]
MAAARGSKQKMKVVREATYGTTPTDPTLIEIPVVNLNRNFNRTLIRSNQIRSHPFLDRIMKGQMKPDFDFQTELQDDTFDVLLSAVCGTTDWATNAIKVTDSLQGLSLEVEAIDLTLFDQFAGGFLNSMDVNFPAEENGIVTASFGGMAKTVSIDAATSVVGGGSVTAAADADPFIFQDAVVTIAGASRPITALSFKLERTVDPLMVLGAVTPREYIPAGVTLTGQMTIPLEDDTESAQLVAMTNVALVAKAADAAGTAWRQFSIPKLNFGRMGRPVQDRGVLLQVIDWEAKYDSSSSTVMSITRTA